MMRKVLIVEDSRTQLERLRALVEAEGHEVQAAGDGQEGLAKATTWFPDLVITDVVMPRMDGYELCLRLRDNSKTREIPIMMLTSKGEPADIIKGLEVGADNFITKPFEDALLLGRLRSLFAEPGGQRARKFRLTMELELFGKKITVTPEKQQIVELLLGTMEELAQANQGLQARARELHQTEEAAQQARREADRANQAKSEFLSRMSHELRTPLNAVLGFAQLLEMDSLSPEQQESVGHILRGGRHLLELINEVLDIARIEAGRLALSLEPVSVREVVQESLDLIRPIAAKVHVLLNDTAASIPDAYVMADRSRLKQVLLNLLSNAAKYNHQGGTITLTCENLPQGRLGMRVSDTGLGIPPDKLERLFIPFERLGAEQTEVEGTGLGLALSKRLIEAMRGSLGVESTLGTGSVFWIDLALAEKPTERLARLDPELPAPADLVASQRARVILYIEDNLSNLKLIQRLLAHRPEVRVLPAMQGRLGLDLAREHRPDLILLDLHLPDIPGKEILRHLQETPETRRIPVVMISADATRTQIDRLLASGARAYLTKPLDVKKFLALLDEILKERDPGHAGRNT